MKLTLQGLQLLVKYDPYVWIEIHNANYHAQFGLYKQQCPAYVSFSMVCCVAFELTLAKGLFRHTVRER